MNKYLIILFFTTQLTGCFFESSNSSNNNDSDSVIVDPPHPLRTLVTEQQITADPTVGRDLPSINEPLPQLGKKLFFSKALGGELDAACVTCHHPFLGGGDGLSLPIGVGAIDPNLLGPGRLHDENSPGFDGGPTVPRNAPSIFNVGLLDQVLFHDGRIETITKNNNTNGIGDGIRTPDTAFGETDSAAINLPQSQSLFPVTSVEEMRGEFVAGGTRDELRDALAARLVNQEIENTWLEAFQEAFASNANAEELITYSNISIALGEYERANIFVNTPWKDYVEGDDNAISDSAKNGALLFYQPVEEGGAGCVGCHSGSRFTDEDYHVVAIPQIGRGKGDGELGDDDFGRERETGMNSDRYKFRTLSLLNVEVTRPWGHNGAYNDLRQIIVHHLTPEEAIANYDFTLSTLQPGLLKENAQTHTQQALDRLLTLQAAGESALKNAQLSTQQIDDLHNFLLTLTDPCVKNEACLQPFLPSMDDPEHDNLRLHPTFNEKFTTP